MWNYLLHYYDISQISQHYYHNYNYFHQKKTKSKIPNNKAMMMITLKYSNYIVIELLVFGVFVNNVVIISK